MLKIPKPYSQSSYVRAEMRRRLINVPFHIYTAIKPALWGLLYKQALHGEPAQVKHVAPSVHQSSLLVDGESRHLPLCQGFCYDAGAPSKCRSTAAESSAISLPQPQRVQGKRHAAEAGCINHPVAAIGNWCKSEQSPGCFLIEHETS